MLTPGVIIDSVSQFFRVTLPGFGLRFYGSESGSVGIKTAGETDSIDYTLPAESPSDNQVLTTTEEGELSWQNLTELLAIAVPLLPTEDPEVYGALYRNPSTNAICMSLGESEGEEYVPSMDFSDPRNSMYIPLL